MSSYKEALEADPGLKTRLYSWTNEDSKASVSFAEESRFVVMFPKYREIYLRQNWPKITALFKQHCIGCMLNLVDGTMAVFTTAKTRDPYAILVARDVIKLLSRSISVEKCKVLFDDNTMAKEVIPIGNMVRNKERFVKRRQRLLGPNGNNLKAIELLTGCYIFVQGNTVSAIGPHKGLADVRRIVEDCMNNIHPIYHIKELMIRRELEKDDALRNENWDRFLPKFNKNITAKLSSEQKRRKKALVKKIRASKAKRANAPLFPVPHAPSKIDLQIESGEYFLKKSLEKYTVTPTK